MRRIKNCSPWITGHKSWPCNNDVLPLGAPHSPCEALGDTGACSGTHLWPEKPQTQSERISDLLARMVHRKCQDPEWESASDFLRRRLGLPIINPLYYAQLRWNRLDGIT